VRLRDATTRMPLGDTWSGTCRADAASPFTPDENALSHLCNMGYARRTCAHFPDNPGCDAVRFLIVSDRDQTIEIAYAMERDHHPEAHGTLAYSRVQNLFTGDAANPRLEHQARAYVMSYLRRRPVAA
jgi:hypothetical protein